jgi:TRAP-type uncharacterized transport system substrate-binding protein
MQQTIWRAVAFIAMAAIVVFPGAAEAGSRSGQISGVSGQAGSKTTASKNQPKPKTTIKFSPEYQNANQIGKFAEVISTRRVAIGSSHIHLHRPEMHAMEPLPKGANFIRAKTLWEIGLHIAGNPATPYGGNRDMVIAVGSGSGPAFRPWLRLATGSAILAEQVANGDGIELAFVNPSALLTQAYRGVGLFSTPLPVRIVAVYPSWDRFVFMVHPRTGIRSLADIKAKRYPLRVSVREDPTHSTHVLIDQAFALHGFALKDIESWGGRLLLCGGPSDPRRLEALARDELDAVFDEGIKVWLDEALAAGLSPIELEATEFATMARLGWRKVCLPKARFPRLQQDIDTLDFSGWPIYANASLPEQVAYDICGALAAREAEIPWEKGTGGTALHMGRESESTPMDVPLHPGAERWYREHGANS